MTEELSLENEVMDTAASGVAPERILCPYL